MENTQLASLTSQCSVDKIMLSNPPPPPAPMWEKEGREAGKNMKEKRRIHPSL